jgi:hypothetical protein
VYSQGINDLNDEKKLKEQKELKEIGAMFFLLAAKRIDFLPA